MKNKTNYYHNKLVALGQKVIKDDLWTIWHQYIYDCGCRRAYYSDAWSREWETLSPCKKHRYLLDEKSEKKVAKV